MRFPPSTNSSPDMNGVAPSIFGKGAEIVSPAVSISNHNTNQVSAQYPSYFVVISLILPCPYKLRLQIPHPSTVSPNISPISTPTKISPSAYISGRRRSHPDPHAPSAGSVLWWVLWATSVHVTNMAGEGENRKVAPTILARYRP